MGLSHTPLQCTCANKRGCASGMVIAVPCTLMKFIHESWCRPKIFMYNFEPDFCCGLIAVKISFIFLSFRFYSHEAVHTVYQNIIEDDSADLQMEYRPWQIPIPYSKSLSSLQSRNLIHNCTRDTFSLKNQQLSYFAKDSCFLELWWLREHRISPYMCTLAFWRT